MGIEQGVVNNFANLGVSLFYCDVTVTSQTFLVNYDVIFWKSYK